MSLTIYKNKKDVPSEMDIINYNDKFFNGMLLKDDEISKQVMKIIDEAKYSSENTFIGRDEALGNINKDKLSTGCKTLLNIIANPEKCFDVIECGLNALSLLPMIRNGNILWENPVLHFVGNAECDIIIDNKHFSDFRSFLEYIMD